MGASGTQAGLGTRSARLLAYLSGDPDNLTLIADAAAAALDEGLADRAEALVERYSALAPLPPALLNIKGLAALAGQYFQVAAGVFEDLLAGYGEPGTAFNLAWCRAMLQDYAGALSLLTDPVLETSSAAPSLKIQMMHHLGELEAALAEGPELTRRFPSDPVLAGALAVVAIDAEAPDLARAYAARAGNNADGLSTLGMLELGEDRLDPSLRLFDQALQVNPNSARALLGKGLGLLAMGDRGAAIPYIDKSAEVFGNHLGTWVAAGWAYFVNGDHAASRERFERALALDDTFAEIHGGLAVLDLAEGQVDSAKRRTEIALRLDPRCFSGALAQSLILAGQGDEARAERIRTIALNAPIGPNGRTIAQAIAGLGRIGRQS